MKIKNIIKVLVLPSLALSLCFSLNPNFKKARALDLEYSFTITKDDFSTVSYADNNREHQSTAVCSTDSEKTMDVVWYSNQIMQSSSTMQWQKSNAYIYNVTAFASIKSVSVTSTAGSFTKTYGSNSHPTSGSLTSTSNYFTVKVGGATGKTSKVEVVFTMPDTSGEDSTSVTGVSLNKSSTTINIGDEETLVATVSPFTAANKNLTWSSSNVTVATVNAGKVTALSIGTTTITVTTVDGSFTATCDVTVVDPYAGYVITGDILTRESTGVTSGSTTYKSWTYSSRLMSYAGSSAGTNDSIQIRSDNSNSGIISTLPGKKIRKVSVCLELHTADSRKINVYGSNTAYQSVTNLFNSDNCGSLLGTLDKTNYYLNITEDYEYIGIRSESGAIYIKNIGFEWEDPIDIAKNNVQNTDSNYQLRFDSNLIEETSTYNFSEIELRFGGKIPLTDWNVIKNDVVEYGCIIKYAQDLTNGKSCLRAEIDSLVDDTTSLEEYVSTFNCMMVSASGNNPYIKTEGENQYALFNGVLDVEDIAYIDLQVCAVSYVKTNTEYIYLNEVKKSARMIATEYASNSEMTAKFGTEALSAFANYVVA